MWYAESYNDTGAWYYLAGGLSASLWTPETYVQTAITLATAPYVAAKIAAAGAQSAAVAARVAVKEVVEEVIGVPIPGKGKSFALKSRVFWSGSSESRAAAESFAKAQGGKTLEMTLPGKILYKITTKRTYPYVKPLWDRASKNYAKGAKGSADVFQSGKKGVRLESVWRNVEYPELIKKGISIKSHVTQ